ncbi:MAG: hypothetical protein FWG15_02560 [Propionibacteriaceae bacterium]|nr:hypothetical protein [Propionibacteriaceae bacterium]
MREGTEALSESLGSTQKPPPPPPPALSEPPGPPPPQLSFTPPAPASQGADSATHEATTKSAAPTPAPDHRFSRQAILDLLPLVLAGAAVLAILGSFLPMISVGFSVKFGPITESYHESASFLTLGWRGTIGFICFFAIVGLGVLALFWKKPAVRIAGGILGIIWGWTLILICIEVPSLVFMVNNALADVGATVDSYTQVLNTLGEYGEILGEYGDLLGGFPGTGGFTNPLEGFDLSELWNAFSVGFGVYVLGLAGAGMFLMGILCLIPRKPNPIHTA